MGAQAGEEPVPGHVVPVQTAMVPAAAPLLPASHGLMQMPPPADPAPFAPAAATSPVPVQPAPVVPPPVASAVPVPVPPGPAAQLGAAFVALPSGKDGSPQSLIIRLDPKELGRVQIKLERTADGPARVDLAVERPDTLLLLMQDRSGLDRALTEAGIPPNGRTLSFSLGDPGTGSGPGSGSGGGSGGQAAHGGGASTGHHAPDGGWPDGRERRSREAAWVRAGIDITA